LATPARVITAANGGNGGTTARATSAQLAILRGRHDPPTAAQIQHQQAASRIASLKFGANHGQPPIAAVQRPNEFHGAHVAAAAAAGAAAGAALATRAPALQKPATPPHLAQAGPGVHPGAATAARAAPRVAHAAPRVAHAAPRVAHVAPHYAMHGPATHPNFAYRAPAMHAPAFHPNFAYHAPTMHAPAFHPNFAAGGMHFGGAPHFAGGGMHFGGAPHMGGGGPRRP
jgi:hypothetical protein